MNLSSHFFRGVALIPTYCVGIIALAASGLAFPIRIVLFFILLIVSTYFYIFFMRIVGGNLFWYIVFIVGQVFIYGTVIFFLEEGNIYW